jgi:hypothetical protein
MYECGEKNFAKSLEQINIYVDFSVSILQKSQSLFATCETKKGPLLRNILTKREFGKFCKFSNFREMALKWMKVRIFTKIEKGIFVSTLVGGEARMLTRQLAPKVRSKESLYLLFYRDSSARLFLNYSNRSRMVL